MTNEKREHAEAMFKAAANGSESQRLEIAKAGLLSEYFKWAEEEYDSDVVKVGLGDVVVTRQAVELLREADANLDVILADHERGHWGRLSQEDREENDRNLVSYGPVGSRWVLKTGRWIEVETSQRIGITVVRSCVEPQKWFYSQRAWRVGATEPQGIHTPLRTLAR